MRIIACIKEVPDSEARIEVSPDGSRLEIEPKYELNYFDELAIEEGLRIIERRGEGSLTAITLSSDRGLEALRKAIAMGAEKAIHLQDTAFEAADGYTTAYLLARAITSITPFDMILCGRKAADDGAAEVGPMLAELLDIPHVTAVVKIELSSDGGSATVEREIEGGKETVYCPLPALFSVQKGLNEPRVPTIQGVMKGMRAKPKVITLAELEAGMQQAPKILGYTIPQRRTSAKIIEGEGPADKAKELVRLLREEAKVL